MEGEKVVVEAILSACLFRSYLAFPGDCLRRLGGLIAALSRAVVTVSNPGWRSLLLSCMTAAAQSIRESAWPSSTRQSAALLMVAEASISLPRLPAVTDTS